MLGPPTMELPAVAPAEALNAAHRLLQLVELCVKLAASAPAVPCTCHSMSSPLPEIVPPVHAPPTALIEPETVATHATPSPLTVVVMLGVLTVVPTEPVLIPSISSGVEVAAPLISSTHMSHVPLTVVPVTVFAPDVSFGQ